MKTEYFVLLRMYTCNIHLFMGQLC